MLDFALKVCLDAQSTSAQDLEVLRGHGFSDDDIWDTPRFPHSSRCRTAWRA